MTQQSLQFKHGLLFGCSLGIIIGVLASYSYFTGKLFSKAITHRAIITSPIFNAETTEISHSFAIPNNPETLPKIRIIKSNSSSNSTHKVSEHSQLNNETQGHQTLLQQQLSNHAYADLNHTAREIISQNNATIAWHYLIQAEIQQGFYLNAINIAAEHITLSVENHQRADAQELALNTLKTIDQLERSQGNTLQLIEIYEHTIAVLSPWLKNSDDLLIALSQCYLAIGDRTSARLTLENLQANAQSPKVIHLLKQIEKAEFTLKRIPLTKLGKHYIATLHIDNETPIKLLLDTGASLSTINQSTFNAIENTILFSYLYNIQVNTAGGTQTGQLIEIEQIMLADINLSQLQFVVLDMNSQYFDGLLGMNILERFEFTIDQQSQELILNKPL